MNAVNDLKRFVVTDRKLTVVYIAGPMSGLPQYNYPASGMPLTSSKRTAALPEVSLEKIKQLQSQCVVDKLLASQRKISKSLIIRLNFECDIEAAAAKASDARANA